MSLSNKRPILILGATGTIGAYAALYLKEKGHAIIATGRRESDNGFFEDFGISYYSVDIKKASAFALFEKLNIGTVIHAAGVMPATMIGYHPHEFIDSIITGTLNVLEFTRKIGAGRIIFTHSRADSNYLMGTKEKIPSDIEKKYPKTGDHSIYAICKNAAVDMVEHYFYQHGIKRFIFRLPTIYAYHPNRFFYVNGIRKPIAYRYIIDQAISGSPIEIWGDPSLEKEITYVGDLCQCFEKAITSSHDGGIYNVGRGIGVSLDEQINGIVEIFCRSDNKSQVNYRPEKPNSRQFIHDVAKTESELGYCPTFEYIELLRAYKSEMEKNRFKKLWGTEGDYD